MLLNDPRCNVNNKYEKKAHPASGARAPKGLKACVIAIFWLQRSCSARDRALSESLLMRLLASSGYRLNLRIWLQVMDTSHRLWKRGKCSPSAPSSTRLSIFKKSTQTLLLKLELRHCLILIKNFSMRSMKTILTVTLAVSLSIITTCHATDCSDASDFSVKNCCVAYKESCEGASVHKLIHTLSHKG